MADFSFSVLTPASRVEADDSALARVLDSALGATNEKNCWEVTKDGHWCYLARHEKIQRAQGWKLHISATLASAETVLARSLPVLLSGRSPFKFAKTIDHVALLNTRHTPRGHSGKFVTVYPYSDEEAVRLAEALHQATAGLAGPRILSDQPYVPMSLVHYRYGAFVEERKISNDGFYAWTILDPDGNPVEDRRVGQYLPPKWVRCPFPQVAGNGSSRANKEGQGVLIGDRFLVREAVRHSNKGGVYRAVDTHSGADIVIKEARAHVAADEAGKDARDLLRVEARALERIGPRGVAPQLLKLFEQGQHLFLAEELVPGMTLREWVPDMIRNVGWRRHVPEAMDQACRLVELMDVVHQAGLIVRDFNPNNIMVLPGGELRLIDLELAVAVEETEAERIHVGTPGYSAPEQMAGAFPAVQADYYSLGATICFIFTGDTPFFLEEVPQGRSVRTRLTEWLTVRGEALDMPADIQMLILGLMDEMPEQRWTPAQVRNALTVARTVPERSPRPRVTRVRDLDSSGSRLGEEQWQQAVDGMVNYLLTSMSPLDSERLWPVSCAFGAPDPCSLQLGAPGILGVLTRYFELTSDQRVAEVIGTAGRWIAARLREGAKRPPGLYFGDAGIAWSLYEAGRVLGDDQLVERGLALADTLPISWSSPDVIHGTAGIGLTFLHLWLRTGNDEFAERASKSADILITSVSEDADGLIWEPPAEFDSRLAGRRHYGYAHGTAGVGYYLLAVALATGRSDCLTLACRVGDTLLANATEVDGVAQWGAGPGDAPTAPYWCHGASGIGSFLTRLHRANGDDRFGKAAQMSAQAVIENSWRGSLGQCHGLAGNGEFLLDMAQAADGASYHTSAHQLARVILTTRAHREDQVVFPNEHQGFSATWGDGVSGILSFFLRLRHRSPRLWMVDALLERSDLS
ncbi:MAG TPA: class IV lanthionine synthetase LanL [Pseudonocardiaceae bacterium]|nr:class IV lanthionine synthetase LanL [Pseudonocardiaceae bacterium]